MIDLRESRQTGKINWFLNQFCFSIRLSRLCALRRYDMNVRFQMQGGKNRTLPKVMNTNRFFRNSLAGNLEKPLLSLYGTEWRERGYGLEFLVVPDVAQGTTAAILNGALHACQLHSRTCTILGIRYENFCKFYRIVSRIVCFHPFSLLIR
jgi:hypothetical protein